MLPTLSFAVHVTVATPIGKRLPDEGVQLTVGDGSRLSVAVTAYVTTAPLGPVALAETPVGNVRLGSIASVYV
jgi:hypothetical protein